MRPRFASALALLLVGTTPTVAGIASKSLPPLDATQARYNAEPVQQNDESVRTPTASLAALALTRQKAQLKVSVSTDKGIYRDGEKVKISGCVFDLSGGAGSALVDVRIAENPNENDPKADIENNAIYRTLLKVPMGPFVVEDYKIQLPASKSALDDNRVKYAVAARVVPIGEGDGDLVFTSFAAVEIGWSRVFKILGPPAIFFVGLTVAALGFTMGKASKRGARYALIALYCASLMFLLFALGGPVLISFSPGTETLFRSTPVGIVRVAGDSNAASQWVLNVGGILGAEGNIGGGLAIPLYILILSLIGAVISMFLALPGFLRDYRAIPETPGESVKPASVLVTEAFKYFTYIVTGPFLGMIAYSLASLLDATNTFVMAIVAFSVGFISDGIVETMVSFSTGLLNRAKRPKDSATTPLVVPPMVAQAVIAQPSAPPDNPKGQ